MQNRFQTGLDIARYTADIMRRDIAATTLTHLNTLSRLAAGMVYRAAKNDCGQKALR